MSRIASTRRTNRRFAPIVVAFVLFLTLVLAGSVSAQDWVLAQRDIVGPAGSQVFGISVTVLPNGNFVVVDNGYDEGDAVDVGAVYLYDGATEALISTLKGSVDNSQVGSGGIVVLANGNFVVRSPNWMASDSSGAVSAVTWVDGATGLDAVVSADNSLVGSTAADQLGLGGIIALSNGNYVVNSLAWDNGTAVNAGAVTWGDGASGVSGEVSAANSIIGSTANDQVGGSGIIVLSNDNYVVISLAWDNGAAIDAGAVTWGDGSSGVTGEVSAANSLVGSTVNDQVGGNGVTELSNGNYVVVSSLWDNGAESNAGAVTWGDGSSGVTGAITAANSLVGSTAEDQVGNIGITALSNGNYVVRSSFWDDGAAINTGAVTWGDGASGVTGVVSAANSLVGSTTGDLMDATVTVLSNGNYVVRSPLWDNGAETDAGAVTWGDGASGVTGVVSAANSLVGSTASDQVGSNGITALANGNYVVVSASWSNGGVNLAGAVTWGNGTSGVTGAVSAANSLVGTTPDNLVGFGGVIALSNGNYVVNSSFWDNGEAFNAGAVTWGDGASGVTGAVSAANSLVGTATFDRVGFGVTALSNGNYVVSSPLWDNGTLEDVGAVTWGDGTSGITGTVSVTNSLVGSSIGDGVGINGVTALSNGNYVAVSPFWNNGAAAFAGAVTWGDGASGITGAVSSDNSFVSSTENSLLGFGGVVELSNGNYLVISQFWNNGAATMAGAVTWGDGASGVTGAVSAANSLVGSTASDGVGISGVTVLSNGNYLVRSPFWHNGAALSAGAITWGDGASGVTGEVSAANSLVGSTADDNVGLDGIMELSNGNYVVRSFNWDNGAATNAGAVTWGDGGSGVSGEVSAANSLVGSTANDQVGSAGFAALGNGDYLVQSSLWDNGAIANAGAISWGDGASGVSGPISSSNSVLGTVAGDGNNVTGIFNSVHEYLLVRRHAGITVTIARKGHNVAVAVTGSGSVTSNLGGVACSDNCSNVVAQGEVTLTASPDAGNAFGGWGGDCASFGSAPTCTLMIDGDKTVTADFVPVYTLSTSTDGAGSGTLTRDPDQAAYVHGTSVTITANPNDDSDFTGWSGCDSTAGNECTVTMTSDRSVTATFTLKTWTLSTSTSGTGAGTVQANPAGPVYNHGESVTLTQQAGANSTFTGWGGACSGAGACVVIMDAARSVNANFEAIRTLVAVASPADGGSVQASPAAPYLHGDTVSLTAVAQPGFAFTGWSGDCESETSAVCNLLMNGDKSVTAHFVEGNGPPAITGLSTLVAPSGERFTANVLVSDPEDDEITIALVSDPLHCSAAESADNSLFEVDSATRTLSSIAPMLYQTRGPLPYHVCLSASDSQETVYAAFALRVEHVLFASPRWGDCDDSGAVNAADIRATFLEIFDDDSLGLPPDALAGVPEWLQAPLGQFKGVPEGCNSNRSAWADNEGINAADLACTVAHILGRPCSDSDTNGAGDSTLAFALPLPNATTPEIAVIVQSTCDARLGALTFAIAFDASVDIAGEESVTINTPAAIQRFVAWDSDLRQLQVALYTEAENGFGASDVDLRIGVGGSGVIASALRFSHLSAATPGGAEVSLRELVREQSLVVPSGQPGDILIWLPGVQC